LPTNRMTQPIASPSKAISLSARLFGDDSAVSQAVRAGQMAIATKGTPPLAAGTLLNSALVAYVLRDAVPWPVLAVWVGLNWIAAVRRMRAWWRNRHRPPAPGVRRRGVMRVTLWSGIAGTLWGLSAIPLLWTGGILETMVIVFVIAGHAAVAATWIAPLPLAYWAYLLPCMLPLIGAVFSQGTTFSGLLGAMLTLYTSVLAYFGWMSYRGF